MAENDPFATYTEYRVERGTSENPGVHLMPVAGPAPQTAQLVILHAPIEYVWVAWTARRRGAPCLMPDPYSLEAQDGNLRFLGGQVSGIVPHPTGDGAHEFMQAGMYYYGRLYALGLNSVMNLGCMPWETDPNGARTPCINNIPANYFVPDILCGTAIAQPGSPKGGNTMLAQPLQDPLGNKPLQGYMIGQ